MKTRIIAVFLLCISLVFCSCAKTEEKTEEVKEDWVIPQRLKHEVIILLSHFSHV